LLHFAYPNHSKTFFWIFAESIGLALIIFFLALLFFDLTVAFGAATLSLITLAILLFYLIPLWLTNEKIVILNPHSDGFQKLELLKNQLGLNKFQTLILPINWPIAFLLPMGFSNKLFISQVLLQNWRQGQDDLWLVRAILIARSPWSFMALITASLWLCLLKMLRWTYLFLAILSKVDSYEKPEKPLHLEKLSTWLVFLGSLPFFAAWSFLRQRILKITAPLSNRAPHEQTYDWEECVNYYRYFLLANATAQKGRVWYWMALCPFLPYYLDSRNLLSKPITDLMLLNEPTGISVKFLK